MDYFKTTNGVLINDINSYINSYLKLHTDSTIYIGTDCKRKKDKYIYATTICLDTNGNGVHYVYRKKYVDVNDVHDIFSKLWREVELSVETSYELSNIDKTKITIDLDYNKLRNKKSNIVYDSAIGLVAGLGLRYRTKPNAWAASCAADYISRK